MIQDIKLTFLSEIVFPSYKEKLYFLSYEIFILGI